MGKNDKFGKNMRYIKKEKKTFIGVILQRICTVFGIFPPLFQRLYIKYDKYDKFIKFHSLANQLGEI